MVRAGFTVASNLVAQARTEAQAIIEDAERRADLLIIKAERAAAAKQSEAEIYLQKARAVLAIAHQRATNRPLIWTQLDGDDRLDLTEASPVLEGGLDGRPLPPGFDRLLTEAVNSAVATSVASSRRTRR